MRVSLLAAGLAASLLTLSACKRTEPAAMPSEPAAPAAAVTQAKPTGTHDNLNAVAWVQTAEEYQLLSGQVYRAALAELDRAIKTPGWDALVPAERANPADGLPPAVIVDIDETVLDNSPYQARLVRDGGSYNEVTWDGWVREEEARPVPGALEFAKAAAERGVTIFYVSNRAAHLNDATVANLKAVGFPIESDTQFLGLGFFVEGCEQHGSEKGCRRQHVGRTHRVLMQFGDQIGDFVQVVANTRESRDQLYDEYNDWFGERWWMLPNPSYGSWEPAVFNNDWRQPREARREAKFDALNVAQ